MKIYASRQLKLEDFVGKDVWVKARETGLYSNYTYLHYIRIYDISGDIMTFDVLDAGTVDNCLMDEPDAHIFSERAYETLLSYLQGERTTTGLLLAWQLYTPVESYSTGELMDQLSLVEVRPA